MDRGGSGLTLSTQGLFKEFEIHFVTLLKPYSLIHAYARTRMKGENKIIGGQVCKADKLFQGI